jgi:hypothetical protein
MKRAESASLVLDAVTADCHCSRYTVSVRASRRSRTGQKFGCLSALQAFPNLAAAPGDTDRHRSAGITGTPTGILVEAVLSTLSHWVATRLTST